MCACVCVRIYVMLLFYFIQCINLNITNKQHSIATILKTLLETVFTSVDIGVSLHLELIIGKYFRRTVLKTDQNIQMCLSNLLANL